MKTTFAILLLAVLFAEAAWADTIIPGGNVSGTWWASRSPYLVQGNITVSTGATLTVQPGVEIIFQNNYGLLVNGTLAAVGTVNDSIWFFPADTVVGWQGIEVSDTAVNCQFIYCNIHYAKVTTRYGGGLLCMSSSTTIEHSTFSHNSAQQQGGGGIMFWGADGIVRYCSISHNYTAGHGGGVKIHDDSAVAFDHTLIFSNFSQNDGGGICGTCSTITNCTISDNEAAGDGGGLFLPWADDSINNTVISGNHSHGGGGIYCEAGTVYFQGTTLCNNTADQGGGLYLQYNAYAAFSSTDRSNIYYNQAPLGRELFGNNTYNTVYLDTFTVRYPTAYYAVPLGFFIFEIEHGLIPQVNADLYVSPTGNNSNSGLSFADPLRNIYYALSIIRADLTNPHAIFLAPGCYSPNTTGEQFPAVCTSHLSLIGSDQATTILDADGQNRVLYCNGIYNAIIQQLTITEGWFDSGSGVYIINSASPAFVQCTISANGQFGTSEGGGGVYSYESSPSFESCAFSNNTSAGDGGGLYSEDSYPVIFNCIFTGNISAGVGGGLYFAFGNSQITNCTFSGNAADWGGGFYGYRSGFSLIGCNFIDNDAYGGGGISLYNSGYSGPEPTIAACRISGNHAEEKGGGMTIHSAAPTLTHVSITNNTCDNLGGGIYFLEGDPLFNQIQRCNIYFNQATAGADLYNDWTNIVTVVVDTFTAIIPNNYLATPLLAFSFDILHAAQGQTSANIYVSPTGNNNNSGVSWTEPLRNIYYALAIIQPTSQNPLTVFLAPGIYSPTTNEEQFPLVLTSFTALHGSGQDSTILDADSTARVINMEDIQRVTITDLTISGGYSIQYGGGVYSSESEGTIARCTIRDNAAGYSSSGAGAGLYTNDSFLMVNSCTIRDNLANAPSSGGNASGGGVCCSDNSVFNDCTISQNRAMGYVRGGGIAVWDEAQFNNCVIAENSSEQEGGGVFTYGNNAPFKNCTFSANSAPDGAAFFLDWTGDATLVNCIFEGSLGGAALSFNSSNATPEVRYSDFYNNAGGNFSGSHIPPGLGQILAVNANGDSCDSYYNLLLDPLLVNPSGGDFHLQAGSPCIDAGDPTSPPDPDFSVADMGAFYYDQATPVMVVLNPWNPPIVIPATGGSLFYDIHLFNNDSLAHNVDVQILITPPSGLAFPVLIRPNLFLAIGAHVYRLGLEQFVPATAAPGRYTYTAYVRDHNTWITLDQESFPFEKLYGWDNPPAHHQDWALIGWEETSTPNDLPAQFALNEAHPNPFNASTMLSFALPEPVQVKLAVYDVRGREVAVLMDGWQEAGWHQVLWDASTLSAGIYFGKMIAGEFTQVRKMVLLK